VLSFTRMFILYIPMALLLNHGFGYAGIFVAAAISNAIMGGLGFLWLRHSFFPSSSPATAGGSG
jgi:Na+-driven multidrug efflux pump